MGRRPIRRTARRTIFAGIAAALALRLLVAEAQPRDGMRRLGVLMGGPNDPLGQMRAAALVQGLGALDWHDGGNLRIDWRWAGGDPALYERYATELIALNPEVLVAWGSPSVAALRRQMSTIPIVLVNVTDPVGQGFVESLAHPGGNITGFSAFEFAISGKWLELMNEIAPEVSRVAFIFNPDAGPYAEKFVQTIVPVAPSFGVNLIASPTRDPAEIDRAITAVAGEPKGGLIVNPDAFTGANRSLIISLAARYRLPAVYPYRYWVVDGGLISYGHDANEPWRRAPSYVDKILKGASPADLPIQQPTKFELIINLKTAKTLGLTIPPRLLDRADELI